MPSCGESLCCVSNCDASTFKDTRATGNVRASVTSTWLYPQGQKPHLPGPESSPVVFNGPGPSPQALPQHDGVSCPPDQVVPDPKGSVSCFPPSHPPCPSIAPASTMGIFLGLPTFPTYPSYHTCILWASFHFSLLPITVLVQATAVSALDNF